MGCDFRQLPPDSQRLNCPKVELSSDLRRFLVSRGEDGEGVVVERRVFIGGEAHIL